MVKTASLDDNLGSESSVNVQGEVQAPLDILAHRAFDDSLRRRQRASAFLSEEQEELTWFKSPMSGDFSVSCDPLNGSSNLDVNLSVGTIFAVTRCSVPASGESCLG